MENSGAQLEHQRTRIMNLDLMLDYGAESWKQYNEVLQDMLNRIQVRPNINREWKVITTLSDSGTAGWGQESNSGSKLEQEEPTDSGQKLKELNTCGALRLCSVTLRSTFLLLRISLLLFLLSSSQVGDKLRQLETSWVGLVSKNYEIEQVRNEIRFLY